MNILLLPILIPLICVVLLIVIRSNKLAQTVSVLGTVLLMLGNVFIAKYLVSEKIITLYIGGWEAPFGISLVVDYFSMIMLTISSFIAFTIVLYSISFLKDSHRISKFYVFFFALLLGVNGAFITGDVFNLYVWFEVMLMSSFILISSGRKKEQLEGGIKYMALNLIGSLLFLTGLGLLYGKTGTLNMADLARILQEDTNATLLNTSAMFFFIAFGIKAAVFPLFFWLPSSYHTPNVTITALFAGLLTKVGVYALVRFFTLFFVQDQAFWHQLLLIVAGLTMVIGGMAASAHYDIRKILSYHIISQIGYMILGLGIHTVLGIAGAIYFTVHNMLAKTNAFFIAGIIRKLKGSFHLKEVGGLLKEKPWLAFLFLIPALALAGIPPLSGFYGKFMLIKAGIDNENFIIALVAVLTSLLTLYSMVKIWNEAFLKKEHYAPGKHTAELNSVAYLPAVLLAAGSIILGFFAHFFVNITIEASQQLLNTEMYINTVLQNK